MYSGDLAAAERLFRQAIAEYPQYDVAYANLGNILLYRGAVADAIVNFEKAVEYYATNPRYLHLLANAYHDQYLSTPDAANFATTEAAYRRVLALDANFAPSLNGLAALFIAEDVKLGEAERLLDKALATLETPAQADGLPADEIAKYLAAVFKNRGLLLRRYGDYAQAILAFQRADEASAYLDLVVLDELAKTYDLAGDAAAACSTRQRLRELYQTGGTAPPDALVRALAACSE
jgi:tetratricopeptide (TPR) repeat protein